MVRAGGAQGGSHGLALREPPHRQDRSRTSRYRMRYALLLDGDAVRHSRRRIPDHPDQPRRVGGVHRHDAAGQQPDRQRRVVGTARGDARAPAGIGSVRGHRRHRARDRSLACALGDRGDGCARSAAASRWCCCSRQTRTRSAPSTRFWSSSNSHCACPCGCFIPACSPPGASTGRCGRCSLRPSCRLW